MLIVIKVLMGGGVVVGRVGGDGGVNSNNNISEW